MRFAVTPYAGVWIEIRYLTIIGLPINVTPYAGVWIEIAEPIAIVSTWTRHSLRGSVD